MLALFILDSLGSTELLFILVVALIFFGPRKLPQLARSMGKSMAEFRKASEDFKRTWEREVALESARSEFPDNSILPEDKSQSVNDSFAVREPLVVPVSADEAVARENPHQLKPKEDSNVDPGEVSSPEPLPKHEWL